MEKLTATAFLVQCYEMHQEVNYLGYYLKDGEKKKIRNHSTCLFCARKSSTPCVPERDFL